LHRLADFCISILFFPSGAPVLDSLHVPGYHAVAEKFFLYIVSRDIRCKGDILEIGSYRGSSSLLLALGNSRSRNRGRVWLVEPEPKPDREGFMSHFRARGLDGDVTLVEKGSAEARDGIDAEFRFIFIDGDHRYEAVKRDAALWMGRLAEGGVIAFHNIGAGGVRKAVDETVACSNDFPVQGTLADTFYAAKGCFRDPGFVRRFRALNRVRETAIGAAMRIGLYERASSLNVRSSPP